MGLPQRPPRCTYTVLAVLPALLALAPAPAGATDGEGAKESDLLSRVRRLTYDGRRAGEGYFSPDGSKMVFQSERSPENPFYQIFLLDLTTGDVDRISPGTGKTTCAFIQPGSGRVVYASTHHDRQSQALQQAELERRARGEERRYAWDYDPEMELYLTDPETGEHRRLTQTRGYDAEASFSPDGRWIVFTSNRQAFEGELSSEDEKRLELDPAFFAEIYMMPADPRESKPRRLTSTPGYDGGPFFFPDGSKVVWRRFDEDGLVADIWTMRQDGSEATQITDFASMSWAPYVHPSGQYIFFASNKYGFGNFELFIVDTGGHKEPVRVTYTDGFDGLPVPTPDGKGLAWTSNRHDGGGGQIYLADWKHERALEALATAPPRKSPDDQP